MENPIHIYDLGYLTIKSTPKGRWNVYHHGEILNPHSFTQDGFFSYDEARRWAETNHKNLCARPADFTIDWDIDDFDFGGNQSP